MNNKKSVLKEIWKYISMCIWAQHWTIYYIKILKGYFQIERIYEKKKKKTHNFQIADNSG